MISDSSKTTANLILNDGGSKNPWVYQLLLELAHASPSNFSKLYFCWDSWGCDKKSSPNWFTQFCDGSSEAIAAWLIPLKKSKELQARSRKLEEKLQTSTPLSHCLDSLLAVNQGVEEWKSQREAMHSSVTGFLFWQKSLTGLATKKKLLEGIGLLFLWFCCCLYKCLFCFCLNSSLFQCLINLTIRNVFLIFMVYLAAF